MNKRFAALLMSILMVAVLLTPFCNRTVCSAAEDADPGVSLDTVRPEEEAISLDAFQAPDAAQADGAAASMEDDWSEGAAMTDGPG